MQISSVIKELDKDKIAWPPRVPYIRFYYSHIFSLFCYIMLYSPTIFYADAILEEVA